MKTGFKKYDSSYKRTESPFTRLSVGIGITTGPRNLERRRREEQRNRDEANKEELLAKAKRTLIKKAERKESKAAKRREQGREAAAARKTRKATKLRKQAGELTADQVVRRREQMRDSSERRKERIGLSPSPTPFASKKLLKKVSSQLKAASKKHAGQAAKIDKATSAMKLMVDPKKFSGSPKPKFEKPKRVVRKKEYIGIGRFKEPDPPGLNDFTTPMDRYITPFTKRRSATGRKKLERTIFPFDKHERVDYYNLGVKGANKRKIETIKAKDMPKEGVPSALKLAKPQGYKPPKKFDFKQPKIKYPQKKFKEKTFKEKTKTPMKKISGPCKAAAKRKFKVWPSAYASGWGVRCTKAGGPSKFGG